MNKTANEIGGARTAGKSEKKGKKGKKAKYAKPKDLKKVAKSITKDHQKGNALIAKHQKAVGKALHTALETFVKVVAKKSPFAIRRGKLLKAIANENSLAYGDKIVQTVNAQLKPTDKRLRKLTDAQLAELGLSAVATNSSATA
jgi:hypothetical protein